MRSTALTRAAVAATLAAALLVGSAGVAEAASAPRPTITAAPTGYINVTSATVSFSSTLKTATFQCSLNGSRWSTCKSPVTYTKLTSRNYTFYVRSQAAGYRSSGSTSRTWTVDLVAPNKPTVSTPTSPTKSVPVSLTFASSSTDIASYKCSLDGAVSAACTSPKSVTVPSDGWHTYSVVAVDRAGNQSAAGSTTWFTDTSTPVPTVSSGPPSLTPSTSATFAYSSEEGNVAFSCSLDAGAYSACNGGKTYTSLANGAHTFTVRATDAAGNVATSTPYAWTRGTTPTTLSWTTTPSALSNQSAAAFSFATNAATTTCTLDGAAPAACAGSFAANSLTDGPHTLTVTANPGAGQVTLAFTWAVDTMPPALPTLSGPTTFINSTSTSVVVRPAAVDDVLTCTLDAVTVTCASLASLTGLTEASHVATAVATDHAGNTSTASLSWVVDLTAPTVTLQGPSTVDGYFVASFANEDVIAASAGNVVLTDQTGAGVLAALTCLTAANATTPCAGTSTRTVRVQPSRPLVANETYMLTVNPATAASKVSDQAGNAVTTTSKAFASAKTVQDSSLGLSQSWASVSTKAAYGGSLVVASRKGANATWRFTGASFGVAFATGPAAGNVEVWVDGSKRALWSTYSATPKYRVVKVLRGLSSWSHRITLRVTGTKGSTKSRGTSVSFDAYRVGTTVVSSPSVLARWGSVTLTSASGRSVAIADLKGARATVTVRGTKVTWTTATCRSCGIASIYVDGKLKATVDTYSATTKVKVNKVVSGLAAGRHVVQIYVNGTKRAGGKGTAVYLDAVSAA